MPVSNLGTGIQFTPVQGLVNAPPDLTVLNLIQAEPQLTHTYYQDGRLLTAVDLNRDFAYLDRRLLDLGLALGDVTVQGLLASMADGNTITVTQGRGIAPSGRVISFSASDPTIQLTANLRDTGTQATLNGASFGGI